MIRVKTKVTLEQARERLEDFQILYGSGPHKASWLAEVIWPETTWINAQGAGAAASRVLKKLGYKWESNKYNWGWRI